MDFYFGQDDGTELAMIHVRHDPAVDGAIVVEVDLGGLSEAGKEVVVRFSDPNLRNDGVFYTDSNGLEMQKREWSTEYPKDLIATNYYPVTSAIKIRDYRDGTTLLVMNDRTQGGTSPRAGTIELMQNRVTPKNDQLGQRTNLIEKDQYGNTVRSFARYRVQLFDENRHKSVQRHVQ